MRYITGKTIRIINGKRGGRYMAILRQVYNKLG